MGIMNRIMQPKALSVTDEKAWNTSLWNLYGAQSHAGVTVTEETALTNAAVWCAVVLLSGTTSTLPLHLMRKEGKNKAIADEKRLYRVLHDQANPYMTSQAFREVGHAHCLTWGNWYAEIVRNPMGEIVELWPIPPNRIRPKMEDGKLAYDVRVDNEQITLPREKILHIPGLGFDGFKGYSVVSMARQAIGLGLAMEEFGARFFGEGTHPGIVVGHPSTLSQQAHDNLRGQLSSAHSGLGKAHKLMLLEEGMKLEKLGIPPEDAQFLQSRQFSVTEIARWFNVPPHKLKDLTRSSFNNIETEQTSYYTESVLTWLVRIEQNLNMQLLSPAERTQEKLYFKHNVEGLLRGDSQARAEFYTKMWGIGAMSINEIREKEDLDPIEGGDEHFVPLNMVPLSRLEEMEYAGKGAGASNGNGAKRALPETGTLRLIEDFRNTAFLPREDDAEGRA